MAFESSNYCSEFDQPICEAKSYDMMAFEFDSSESAYSELEPKWLNKHKNPKFLVFIW